MSLPKKAIHKTAYGKQALVVRAIESGMSIKEAQVAFGMTSAVTNKSLDQGI